MKTRETKRWRKERRALNASLKLPGRGKSISIEEIKQLLERYRAALRKTGE
ncbi:hypothetical protein B4114_1078 [Geobacillus stearothermophilus]|uniref:Phage protein n=1 Tax=Geobacillus stearothermophilus TaxID=1422 RepID=A0A150NA06_GEOSE|nr:hypothetical protein B4114_1078 [Geobacillus stearothermophilus]